jgi:hypothetical protein
MREEEDSFFALLAVFRFGQKHAATSPVRRLFGSLPFSQLQSLGAKIELQLIE